MAGRKGGRVLSFYPKILRTPDGYAPYIHKQGFSRGFRRARDVRFFCRVNCSFPPPPTPEQHTPRRLVLFPMLTQNSFLFVESRTVQRISVSQSSDHLYAVFIKRAFCNKSTAVVFTYNIAISNNSIWVTEQRTCRQTRSRSCQLSNEVCNTQTPVHLQLIKR